MRPRIGITVVNNDPDHVPNYLAALKRAGADIEILSADDTSRLDDKLSRLDALLLPGGGDIDPAYYGEAMDGSELKWMDRVRDELELVATRIAVAQDMPVLGICRGCQVLNVALGGSLAQHVDEHRVGSRFAWAQHKISIEPGTKLSQILGGRERVTVNSRHHQAVTAERLAPGLVASAVAEAGDGVIEAIEAPDRTWVLAVQWHPERTEEVPAEQSAIFDAFIEAARRFGRTAAIPEAEAVLA